MVDTHSVSVGELDRAFGNSQLKCNWNLANLDQIVEMILMIKKNDKFNEHKAAQKYFTVVFTLANQNQQNIVTKTIAESFNTHKYGGHSLLHARRLRQNSVWTNRNARKSYVIHIQIRG